MFMPKKNQNGIHSSNDPSIPAFEEEMIEVIGANAHNLKNLSLQIPRNKMVVITGICGSGRSTLWGWRGV